MPTIRLEEDVLQALKKLAEPFVDTPSSVIRRLLEKEGVLALRDIARSKAAAGSPAGGAGAELTPQPVYEQYLLATLERQFEGRGDKRSVTNTVLEKMRANGFINAGDLELVATGETKAENTVSWARNALKERGYISRHSPRGTWELTREGREAATAIQLKKLP